MDGISWTEAEDRERFRREDDHFRRALERVSALLVVAAGLLIGFGVSQAANYGLLARVSLVVPAAVALVVGVAVMVSHLTSLRLVTQQARVRQLLNRLSATLEPPEDLDEIVRILRLWADWPSPLVVLRRESDMLRSRASEGVGLADEALQAERIAVADKSAWAQRAGRGRDQIRDPDIIPAGRVMPSDELALADRAALAEQVAHQALDEAVGTWKQARVAATRWSAAADAITWRLLMVQAGVLVLAGVITLTILTAGPSR